MTNVIPSLMSVYSGWDGHQLALVRAVTPLTKEQLSWQAAPHLRTVGALTEHIVTGRIGWIYSILGVKHDAVTQWMDQWIAEGNRNFFSAKPEVQENPAALVSGLEATWAMIESILTTWTTDDLVRSFHHPYQGKTYDVPYQWVLWRIMSHDMHHGGELAFALGIQGINLPDLGDAGGHLNEVPEAHE